MQNSKALETALTHFTKDAANICLQMPSLQCVIGTLGELTELCAFWGDVIFQPQTSQSISHHAFFSGKLSWSFPGTTECS